MRTYLAAFILAGLFSCNAKNPEKNCNPIISDLTNETFKTKGCIINDLEEGEWQLYDSTNKITEWGEFNKGVHTGKWHYNSTEKDSLTEWQAYENKDLQLRTNIPTTLKLYEVSLNAVKFSTIDSSNLINLIINLHDMVDENIDIHTFHQIGENELRQNNLQFSSTKDLLITGQDTIYFNSYFISGKKIREFHVFNIYRNLKKNKLLEITCRYNELNKKMAWRFFSSVASNIYIDTERFINPRDKKMLSSW